MPLVDIIIKFGSGRLNMKKKIENKLLFKMVFTISLDSSIKLITLS